MAEISVDGKIVRWGDGLAAEATGENTYLGTGALESFEAKAENNIALGQEALKALTSGSNNIAVGHQALLAATTATQNIAIGQRAVSTTKASAGNIGIGHDALEKTSTGEKNIAIGTIAMGVNTKGNENVAIGASAMSAATTGNANVVIGAQAGTAMATASGNVIIGDGAGASLVTGPLAEGNIFIGYNAGKAETGNNKLYISNSETATPLIYGDFTTLQVRINENLRVTNDLEVNGRVIATGIGKVKETLTAEKNFEVASGTVKVPEESVTGKAVTKETLAKTKLEKSVQEELLQIAAPTAIAEYTSAKEETETKGTFITLVIITKAKAEKAIVKLENSAKLITYEWDALAAGAQRLQLVLMVKKGGKWKATLEGSAEKAEISRVTMEP